MISNGSVLVIDDDPSVRKALSRLIRSAGLEVETFSSAPEFLTFDIPDRPTCVVLDVRLPGLSGLDLQEELNRADLEIPIIFISGHGNVHMSVAAMKAGAVDFLEKPFHGDELLDAIKGALARDRRFRLERAERAEIRSRVNSLTPRERQVFELVVTGLLNKQIGFQLGASEKTIKVHRARVMRKMRAGSLADLVRLAEKVGISGPNP
ncbi:MAG: response regulator transcription factor [Acidobacteriota bacterium]